MAPRKSSRRATVASRTVTQPVVSATPVEHNATVGEVAPAVAVQARAGATRSGGLVDRAVASMTAAAVWCRASRVASRASGKCIDCEAAAEPNRARCRGCLDYRRDQARDIRAAAREGAK